MPKVFWIQIILTLIGVAALERVVARWRARFVGAALTAVFTLCAAVFFLFVWRPDYANRFAAVVGVGRGVDALLYLAVAICLYTLLRVVLRLETQEHLITKLVSEIALLRHAHSPEQKHK